MTANANTIEKELSDMWKSVAEEEKRQGKPGVMRASSVNLMAVVDEARLLEGVKGLVADVMCHHPIRGIIMIIEPDAPTAPLEAQTAIQCSLPSSEERQICCEQITMHARGKTVDGLSSAAASLLMTDLPVFLWWPGTPDYGTPFFESLLDLSDHLVVDSATFHEPEDSLVKLVAFTRAAARRVNLLDLNWSRLTPWREMASQFFDTHNTRPYLHRIEKVAVEYEPAPGGERQNRSQPLLVVGWLASRLGWEKGAVEVEIRAGPSCSGEEKTARKVDYPPGSLTVLRLEARGAAFTIRRSKCGSRYDAVSEVGDMPPVERAVQAKTRTESELMCDELDIIGRDVLYEEALRAACRQIEAEKWK